MRIESILIRGFRCFSRTGQRVELDRLTCFVGPNASGKTSAMAALSRLFGESQSDRTVRPGDFHLDPAEKLESQHERSLVIEAKLVFPELASNESAEAVPEMFNQMVVDTPSGVPYCRIRLDATWTADGTATGDVQQRLWWVTTASDEPEVIEANRKPVHSTDRSRIRVVYVPATRDPNQQIRSTTTTAFGRILKAIDWSGKDVLVRKALTDLNDELKKLQGIGTVGAGLQDSWNKLYDGRIASNVSLQGIEPDPSVLLDSLTPSFMPNEQGQPIGTSELSDGLRSLFALSLPLGIFTIEQTLRANAAASGFLDAVSDALPLLTVFAVEEPENHLSPHYLGKVVMELARVSKMDRAQIVLSSHSPSIMRRVEPDAVRYFLGGENRLTTEVRKLKLPENSSEEAFKFVREAVRGYPELYFSRVVVIGEGPSEEIILKRLFEASGSPLDATFVSVVPIGGRHVNHFWRLLHGLGIPYVTLLDLDREKDGAGWGRIQYARNQLLALHVDNPSNLEHPQPDGSVWRMGDQRYDNLHSQTDRDALDEMQVWIAFLQRHHNIFYSAPLDIDLSMLAAFETEYTSLAPQGGGPRLPLLRDPKREAAAIERMRFVLAADPKTAPPELGSTYTAAEKGLFPWYKYLFLDGSKPVSHMLAIQKLEDTRLLKEVPLVLRDLVHRVQTLASSQKIGAGH
jgi:putative ATP-dependent endonuclease of OLD family